jgi:hypothetical protein
MMMTKTPLQLRREAEERKSPRPAEPLGKPDPSKRPILARARA